MRYFITGTAGFIGFHLAQRLLMDGHDVAGYDGMTSYYDVGAEAPAAFTVEEERRFSCRRSKA